MAYRQKVAFLLATACLIAVPTGVLAAHKAKKAKQAQVVEVKTEGEETVTVGEVSEEMGPEVKDLWELLRTRKKMWLAPIIIFMLMLGALLVFAQGSVIAPFIYTLF